ncbi:F-box only protein 7-like [Oppia nitens]|uniref:F-box only protein 7-like n=1 Tax=Oppia nitens TaxID=1686743 RepID=UPI0023DA4E99|nr:F-box only protein 7-like [Oppia nitens]
MSLSRQSPIIIYKDVLIPMLEENGFKLISSSENKCDQNRYITRHRFLRQTPLRPKYWEQNVLPEVEVVGIPMSCHFLIVHAIVCQSSDDNVKMKIKMNDSMDGIRNRVMNEFIVKLIELLSISINDLPFELKLKILTLLPIESLFKMALVSTLWRAVTLDDQLWRVLVRQHFFHLYDRGLNGESWKCLYKEAFRNQKLSERRKSWATRGLPSSMILPALPPSPPRLPIMGPPFVPMLPPPPSFFRDLVPEEIRNVFPNIPRNGSRNGHSFAFDTIS